MVFGYTSHLVRCSYGNLWEGLQSTAANPGGRAETPAATTELHAAGLQRTDPLAIHRVAVQGGALTTEIGVVTGGSERDEVQSGSSKINNKCQATSDGSGGLFTSMSSDLCLCVCVTEGTCDQVLDVRIHAWKHRAFFDID